MKKFISIILISLLGATSAVAKMPTRDEAKNVFPYIERDHCKASPNRPEWARDDEGRYSYYDNLARRIYRILARKNVLKTGDCSCKTMYPSWKEAADIFNEHYDHLEIWEVRQAYYEWSDRDLSRSEMRKVTMTCLKQDLRGNK